MQGKKLVGCIDTLNSAIRTRFFYVSENEVRDVTLELCEAVDSFNNIAREIRSKGEYSIIIPYEYKYGLAKYSFGCGLSHYLQEEYFELIEQRHAEQGKELSFPLSQCSISMYTPNDVNHILGCKSVFDPKVVESIKDRYCTVLV